MGILISAPMYNNNDKLALTSSFNMYDGNQTYHLKGKTNENGILTVTLPVEPNGEKTTLTFMLTRKEKIRCESQAKAGNSNKGFVAEKKEFEIEEGSITIVLDRKEIRLDRIDMTIAYDKEKAPLKYKLQIAESALPPKLKELGDRFFGDTLQEVKKSFKIKDITLSTENIWNLLRRGICPAYFKNEQDGNISTEFHWDAYKLKRADSLTDVCKAYFTPKGELLKIDTQFRKGVEIAKSAEDLHPLHTFFPKDEDFTVGKRILTNNALVYGQLYHHLILRHYYGTEGAKLIIDYLPDTSVLGRVLKPHTKLIQTITEDVGGKAIAGPDGILGRSGLPAEAVVESVPRGLGGFDPFGRPRKKMGDDDRFAEAQELFYKAVKKAIGNYITSNWDVVRNKEWGIVSTFFGKVHKASPEYHAWESEYVKMDEWVDSREIGGYKNKHVPPRTKYHESDREVRSIPRIAGDDNGPKEATDKDPIDDRLATIDYAAHYITQVAFNHSFIHRTQYIDSPDVPNIKDFFFSPIALQNQGRGDDFISLEDAAAQASLGKTFEDFPVEKYQFLNNEEILPEVRDAVREIAPQLAKLGYPVEYLTGSIVI